jgi:UDP-glucose 4-epimerase
MAIAVRGALVTGGAGFIGSHLVEALVAGECRVTVLDDLSSGRQSNLEPVAGSIQFIHGSICDRGVVEKASAGCEVVFHLAAVVSVPKTVADPLGSAAVNEIGSLNVLEAARAVRARRVVFASSSAVYGDEPALPKREDMPPKPLTPYAVQKLAVENYLQVYRSLYGLETVGLRFFNVFGPRQDPSSPYSGVISIFMNKAFKGERPHIYGDGGQTRDFVFVGDVVRALMAAAVSPSGLGKVFNVGTGASLTINDLWKAIAALSGCKVAPLYRPPRSGDILHSVSAIDSAAANLGFSPQVSLEKGLQSTLDWYRESSCRPF